MAILSNHRPMTVAAFDINIWAKMNRSKIWKFEILDRCNDVMTHERRINTYNVMFSGLNLRLYDLIGQIFITNRLTHVFNYPNLTTGNIFPRFFKRRMNIIRQGSGCFQTTFGRLCNFASWETSSLTASLSNSTTAKRSSQICQSLIFLL